MGLMRPVTWVASDGTITWGVTGNLTSNHFDIGSLEARLKLQVLSGGAIHDMGNTVGAQGVVLPYPRRVVCQLKNATPGTVATDYATILDLVSYKGTMTAEDTNGTEWTSPMYLFKVNADLGNEAIDTLTYLQFQMIFTQLEDWTEV